MLNINFMAWNFVTKY